MATVIPFGPRTFRRRRVVEAQRLRPVYPATVYQAAGWAGLQHALFLSGETPRPVLDGGATYIYPAFDAQIDSAKHGICWGEIQIIGLYDCRQTRLARTAMAALAQSGRSMDRVVGLPDNVYALPDIFGRRPVFLENRAADVDQLAACTMAYGITMVVGGEYVDNYVHRPDPESPFANGRAAAEGAASEFAWLTDVTCQMVGSHMNQEMQYALKTAAQAIGFGSQDRL